MDPSLAKGQMLRTAAPWWAVAQGSMRAHRIVISSPSLPYLPPAAPVSLRSPTLPYRGEPEKCKSVGVPFENAPILLVPLLPASRIGC